MTGRLVPNETVCPVAVDLLALLLRSDETRVAETVRSLPPEQRAALAAFCFQRSHMRSLSFKVAIQCDAKSLRIAAGSAGEALIEQSRSPTGFDAGPKLPGARIATLARRAA